MSITLKKLLDITAQRYDLQLLAASDELEYIVTWAHMLEHTDITEFFWGNEMVVTSGYEFRTVEAMQDFVTTLVEHGCSGLVINVGKYVQTIPHEIIQFCDTLGLPLLTMPWEKSITEFVRECCSLIDHSNDEEKVLTETVLSVIQNPAEAETRRDELDAEFIEDQGFIILMMRMRMRMRMDDIWKAHSSLIIHTALRPFKFPYLLFRREHRSCLLLNTHSETEAVRAAKYITRALRNIMGEIEIHVGVSQPVLTYTSLTNCMIGATAAARRAVFEKQDIVLFENMGFYKLLYSAPNDEILRDYYQEQVGTLIDFDLENSSDYTETLFRYVLSGGSLKEVAACMHTHRNTIYYRMAKIRELLDCPLENEVERFPYELAYHVGLTLRILKPLI